MRQAGILAAAGLYAFEYMVKRLNEDHMNAQELASGLNEIAQISIDVNKVSTNLLFFHLNITDISDGDFLQELLKHNIKIDSKGGSKFRMATHSGFKNNSIEKVIKTIKLILCK